MLEGLDAVDWAAVEHAYGPATEVPDLLRALRSADPATREQARHELFGTIVHQGTRYAATAPAVPFLAELALAPDTPDRHWLVILLTYAAIGYDEASLPAGIVELDQLARTTSMPGKEHKYGPWALAAYQAVQAAMPSLLPLLDHDDVRLRRAVAHLAAWFPRWAPASLPRLRRRLAAEPDPDAKATMLVALGLLAGAQAQTEDAPRLTRLLGEAEAVVRWAAAVALARLFPQAPPEPAVRELLGWLTGETTAGRHPQILFCDPQEYALLALRSVPGPRERAAEAILARLPALPDAAALSSVWDLVELAFEADHRSSRSGSRSWRRSSSGCCGRWWSCPRCGRPTGTASLRSSRCSTTGGAWGCRVPWESYASGSGPTPALDLGSVQPALLVRADRRSPPSSTGWSAQMVPECPFSAALSRQRSISAQNRSSATAAEG